MTMRRLACCFLSSQPNATLRRFQPQRPQGLEATMSSGEERRLRMQAMRAIEEAEFGLGDITRGVDFPMAQSRTSGSLAAENLQSAPPSSSQGQPGAGDSTSSGELRPPASHRGRAPSSSSGEVLPIRFAQRSRAPSSSGGRQPAPSSQRSRESSSSRLQPPTFRHETTLAAGPSPLHPQASLGSITPSSEQSQRSARREGPGLQNQVTSSPAGPRPPTLARTPAHRYRLFPRTVSHKQLSRATPGPGGLQLPPLHHNRMPTSGRPPASSHGERPDFQPQFTTNRGGFSGSGYQSTVYNQRPGVPANAQHVGSQPCSNFQQPSGHFGHQTLSPGSFSRPQPQVPQQPGKNVSLQYPTAEMIVRPQPATLQVAGAEQAGQTVLCLPSALTGPILQSVEAIRALQLVQSVQDFPEAQAALTSQTTRATHGSSIVETADVVQALQDVLNGPASSPLALTATKRLRRRLQAKRPTPPRFDRTTSSPPSTSGSTSTQDTTLSPSRSHLVPNNPCGYFAPPAFQHNWQEPNRRAAYSIVDPRRAITSGYTGPPVGSVPNQFVRSLMHQDSQYSQYQQGQEQEQEQEQGRQEFRRERVDQSEYQAEPLINRARANVQGYTIAPTSGGMSATQPVFSYDPAMSSYEAEVAATILSNEAAAIARPRPSQAEPPNSPRFGYFDHAAPSRAAPPPPSRVPPYASGADPKAGLMSADQARVAVNSNQRLTLMVDGGFDCAFGAATKAGGEKESGEGDVGGL
ncbi:hypothetical protein B0T14DRAFT_499290 [Immersiella caudata]|uniref:Uncharacterized protein n=1 Tax=Immersiella caudata TaxID=314043 RepID=A0AA39WEF7_9PEZI|nr:hypothetical protein B0T14DRAFT_499290 [Immersiella caudata]